MPTPREPAEPSPDLEFFTKEFEYDRLESRNLARSMARTETKRWLPTIRAILDESKTLIATNPSASVVWSVQALEIFLKKAVLGPALLTRFEFDTELTDKVFDALLGRNGQKAAEQWLAHLFGLTKEHWLRNEAAALRNTLFGNRGIGDWRNKIVHQGYRASQAEAEAALEAVQRFVEYLDVFFTE